MNSLTTLQKLLYISPILATAAWAVILLLVDVFSEEKRKAFVGHLALVALATVGILELFLMRRVGGDAQLLFSGRVILDAFAIQVFLIVTAGAFLTVLLSPSYLERHGIDFGEYYPLLLFSLAGMMIIGCAGDLMVLVIGIETMSLPIYALCGAWRRQTASTREEASLEASFKYFLLGAFSTAVTMYGVALVYGATGTTLFADLIGLGSTAANKGLLVIGMVLLIAGLGFKVAAVPFHMWTPDVYEGAPTPVTGFMAAAVKTAAFAAVLRVFTAAFGAKELAFGTSGWTSMLAILAALTMLLGNLAALKQQNIKRMLAYSSIAHAGYMLIGVIAAATPELSAEARSGVLFYLWAYTFTTVGAFGVISWMGAKEDRERTNVEDWNGLAQERPAMALAMTIFLLSLAGVPPTAGFFGKLFLFKAALGNSGLIWLVVLGLLTSVVSVFYYLRVVVAMYFKEPAGEGVELKPLSTSAPYVAVALATTAVLLIGMLPGRLWGYASRALMGF